MKTRIEVTFNSGKFVAFPDVNEDTINTREKFGEEVFLSFAHGKREDEAHINMMNVDYIEIMHIED